MLEDLRSGSLWHACEALAELWTTDLRPTFVDSVKIFKTAHIALFKSCSYGPTSFILWLAKAEQITITANHRLGCLKGSSDWDLLATMASGAAKGIGASAIVSYQDALSARDELAKAIAASGATAAASSTTVAGASDAIYGLDDLICFLCLSQNIRAEINAQLALVAAAVRVAVELGHDFVATSATSPWRPRLRVKTPTKPSSVLAISVSMSLLVAYSSLSSAKTLSRCCKLVHAYGIHLSSRFNQSKRSIADSVAKLFSSESKAGGS